jgi:transcriptional regulator with XRE-family HTH domain
MTNIRKLLGKNIRTFRLEQGVSQEKLAELAQTAPHYILMIENARSWPSPEILEHIAQALGKDTVDLFSLASVQWDWKRQFLHRLVKFIKDESDAAEPPAPSPDLSIQEKQK